MRKGEIVVCIKEYPSNIGRINTFNIFYTTLIKKLYQEIVELKLPLKL